MSDNSGMKKFVHDLSNKIMILEGYLSTYTLLPEQSLKDILAKCVANADAASEILLKIHKLLETDDSLTALLYCSKINDMSNIKDVVTTLEEIDHCAHEYNVAHNISGYLLYIDGYFIHYIEGNSEVIKNLYLNICLDPRHKSISLLSHTSITKRAFQDWHKVFKLNKHELSELPAALDAILSNKASLMSGDGSLGLINFVEMLAEQRLVATKEGSDK
jgi:hypothetical protein